MAPEHKGKIPVGPWADRTGFCGACVSPTAQLGRDFSLQGLLGWLVESMGLLSVLRQLRGGNGTCRREGSEPGGGVKVHTGSPVRIRRCGVKVRRLHVGNWGYRGEMERGERLLHSSSNYGFVKKNPPSCDVRVCCSEITRAVWITSARSFASRLAELGPVRCLSFVPLCSEQLEGKVAREVELSLPRTCLTRCSPCHRGLGTTRPSPLPTVKTGVKVGDDLPPDGHRALRKPRPALGARGAEQPALE